jgi:nitroimidazol reductase NimA-like FMN-containing flavoprotein (pyridoxamine 5'-phosphate oxidase superfamily)
MAGHIPWHFVDVTLAESRSVWIATTRPDGRPHAMPVWFWWNGRSPHFITQRSTQKARNLAHEPWVVLHAGHGDDAIILEGRAVIVMDEEELARIDAGYRDKYVDPGSGASASIFNEGDDCYRVDVEHVMAWLYGAMGTRTDWRFPPRSEE